jgi:hypothetical protein
VQSASYFFGLFTGHCRAQRFGDGGWHAIPVGVQIRLAGFGSPDIGVVLMGLGEHGVVQTFALAAGLVVALGLFVVISSLCEMFSGVVVMMSNLDGHSMIPVEKKVAPRGGPGGKKMITQKLKHLKE